MMDERIKKDLKEIVEELKDFEDKIRGHTFLVTGGAGFLGTWFCDVLNEFGADIICVDNFIVGNKNNIDHLMNNKNFKFVQADILDYEPDEKIDYIIHMACIASPMVYFEHPIETLDSSVIATKKMLELGIKNKIKGFLLTSTSEIYGDPPNDVIPTPETFHGIIHTTSSRAMYDEGKRVAETYTYYYWKKHGVPVRIARIFNSILADQPVVLFNDNDFHFMEIGKYVDSLTEPKRILVPSFDPSTLKISLFEVSDVIKHPYNSDSYEIATSYGRKVKVTGDHSVFTLSKDQKPIAIPVRKLKIGDHIAIPARLPVVEKDIKNINVSSEIIKNHKENDLWYYKILSPEFDVAIENNRKHILELLKESGRYTKNTLYSLNYKYKKQHTLPLFIVEKLKIKIPKDAKIRINVAGAHIYIPNEIDMDDEVLWLAGLFLAEGSSNYKEGKNYFISFSSDDYLLEKAKQILEKKFNVHVIYQKAKNGRPPAIFIHSKVLYFLFNNVFKLTKQHKELRFPSWVFQLPLSKLKYVLEGFREGDGTHSGKKIGNELCFDTKYEGLANDIIMLLLRFGIIASFGKYKTKFKKKYNDREFPFFRTTICNLSSFNILEWDKGVKQILTAKKTEDIVWARIKSIKKCKSTEYVYDFSVPGSENFIAGNGICCHNTYGPRLDSGLATTYGRALINFVRQAKANEPITIFGDGKQTRSFCYVVDTMIGLFKLLLTDGLNGDIINIGNDKEITILDLAKKIIKTTGSRSEIKINSQPAHYNVKDDPKRRCPNIEKAKKMLAYEPTIKIDEGLKRVLEHV